MFTLTFNTIAADYPLMEMFLLGRRLRRPVCKEMGSLLPDKMFIMMT